jgi:hypothetical protein
MVRRGDTTVRHIEAPRAAGFFFGSATYMLDIERVEVISDEMRAVVESEWPELSHKLPPKKP